MMLSQILPDRMRSRRFEDQRRSVQRAYVIGDIHGRLDLFVELVALIKQDHASRGPVSTRLVLLGDLIDRGPDSATLVQWCKALTESSDQFVVLKGNHEAFMVEALYGDEEVMALWLQHGGRDTLESWGVSVDALEQESLAALIRQARRAVGSSTLSWMASLPLMDRHAGHVFVHAGIRPGVALDQQREEDLLWIRQPFLDSGEDHGATVVHGHTIHEHGPDLHRNRINIDTGAYRTGVLTAIGIEAGERWFLSTDAPMAAELDRRTALAALQP